MWSWYPERRGEREYRPEAIFEKSISEDFPKIKTKRHRCEKYYEIQSSSKDKYIILHQSLTAGKKFKDKNLNSSQWEKRDTFHLKEQEVLQLISWQKFLKPKKTRITAHKVTERKKIYSLISLKGISQKF